MGERKAPSLGWLTEGLKETKRNLPKAVKIESGRKDQISTFGCKTTGLKKNLWSGTKDTKHRNGQKNQKKLLAAQQEEDDVAMFDVSFNNSSH